MNKLVRYNGETESYESCSDPNVLVKGRVYEVDSKEVRPWQTNYILKGVRGKFNSIWFDEVESDEDKNEKIKAYLAITKNRPIEGMPMQCSRLEVHNNQVVVNNIRTSTVVQVFPRGNIWNVRTLSGSIYYVLVC